MINIIAQFETTLSSGISKDSTTGILLSNSTGDNDGSTIPNGDYGIVIDERNSKREYAIITIDGFNFTFVKRGLSFIDGDTVKAGNKFDHRKGAVVKIVTHPILPLIVRTFNGQQAFGGIPLLPASRTISNPRHVVDKEYADEIAVAGVIASSTVRGNTKLSSDPSTASNPVALNSEEVSATAGANKVVRSNSNGKIAGDFISDNAESGLEVGTNGGTQIKLATNGGISKDSSGLSSVMTATASASDNSQISSDANKNMLFVGTSYVLAKEIQVKIGGKVRVKFDAKTDNQSNGFAKIYVDGIAVGTERTLTTSYTNYSEDILVRSFSSVQIYTKNAVAGSMSSDVKNFRISFDVTRDNTTGSVITN